MRHRPIRLFCFLCLHTKRIGQDCRTVDSQARRQDVAQQSDDGRHDSCSFLLDPRFHFLSPLKHLVLLSHPSSLARRPRPFVLLAPLVAKKQKTKKRNAEPVTETEQNRRNETNSREGGLRGDPGPGAGAGHGGRLPGVPRLLRRYPSVPGEHRLAAAVARAGRPSR